MVLIYIAPRFYKILTLGTSMQLMYYTFIMWYVDPVYIVFILLYGKYVCYSMFVGLHLIKGK